MNQDTIVTRVQYKIGRGGDTSLDTDILDAMNKAQREIQLLINLQECLTSSTLSLVDGTQTYSLATDFGKMLQIWNNSTYDHELTRITALEYSQYLGDVDTTEGTPLYYDIYDTSSNVKRIHIYPVPSANATAPYMYYKILSDFPSGGSGANPISTYYPDLLIEGAAYYLYRDVLYREQPERIAFRRQEFDREIELVKRAQRQPDLISRGPIKRLRPSRRKLYSTQYSGYTS